MEKTNMIFMFHSAIHLYTEVCKPVCENLKLPQTAFDILMFLGNHPTFNTARDITKYSGIKKNLVSMHMERLVDQGYVVRESVPGDRRQIKLVLTEKALSVVRKGRQVQKYFYEYLVKGLSEEELDIYGKCIETIAANVEELRSELKKEGKESV